MQKIATEMNLSETIYMVRKSTLGYSLSSMADKAAMD
jgi:predicted PhzF superfamily epimerase YddE/YHI9